jgi:hypothetical protein
MADHRDCLHLLYTLVQRHAAKSASARGIRAGLLLPLSRSSTSWGVESDKEVASFTSSGSGTTFVKESRLVISGCFECLEDLSHFLAPLIGVGAVHPAGCYL